jgi:hypothetical protein
MVPLNTYSMAVEIDHVLRRGGCHGTMLRLFKQTSIACFVASVAAPAQAESQGEVPAQDLHPVQTGAAEGQAKVGLVVGAGMSLDVGPMTEAALGWDVYAGYYALPWLVTSAALTRSLSDDNEGQSYQGWLFAGRAAAHPFPRFVIDPWVAFDVGFASARDGFLERPPPYDDRDSVFIGGGIGVDFVAFQTVAGGLHVRGRLGFDDQVGRDMGVHAEARF